MKALEVRQGVSQKTGQEWKSQEFLLEFNNYGRSYMVLNVMDGSAGRIGRFLGMIGKEVKVYFDIDANEYNGRWFNKIKAWGIEDVTPYTPDAEQVQQHG